MLMSPNRERKVWSLQMPVAVRKTCVMAAVAAFAFLASGCDYLDAVQTNIGYGIRDSGGHFDPFALIIGALWNAAVYG